MPLRPYSQQQFVEELKNFTGCNEKKASSEFFALCNYDSISLYRFNDRATGVLILFDDLYE